MFRRLKRLLKLYIASAAITFGLLFFTSLPPNLLATLAWKQWGVEILGIKGSFYKGVTASRLKWKSDYAEVTAEGFRMESVAIVKFLLERRFEVARITLAKLQVRIFPGAERAPAASNAANVSVWRKLAALGSPGEIRLGSLSVSSASIQRSQDAEPFQLERAELTDLRVSISEVFLSGLLLKSPHFDFQMSAAGRRDEAGALKVNTQIATTLPASNWKLLKNDLTLTGTGFIEDSGIFELKFTAFDGKLLASTDTSGLTQLETKEWNPADALNTKVPFHSLSLFAQLSPGAAEFPVSMNFKVGNSAFTGKTNIVLDGASAPIVATHVMEKPGGVVTLRMNPVVADGGRVFEFESNSHSDIGEILSYLHFNKPYASISVEEKLRLSESFQ